MEEVNRSGGNAGVCHAQMYVMGALVRHGSAEQKERWLPQLAEGELRLQAFGVTEPTAGSDTTRIQTRAERDGDEYVITGQKIWTSRAEHSDLMLLLARTTPLEAVKRRTEGLSLFVVDLRDADERALTIRPLETMINHHTTEIFFDGLRVPAGNRIGEEGMGFRYILDGMNAERILIAAESIGTGVGLLSGRWRMRTSALCLTGRLGRTGRAVSDCAGVREFKGGGFDAVGGGAAIRQWELLRGGGKYGEDAGGGRGVGGGECLLADARRIRLCAGARCGEEVPRGETVSDCACFEQSGAILFGATCVGVAAILLGPGATVRMAVIREGTRRGAKKTIVASADDGCNIQ